MTESKHDRQKEVAERCEHYFKDHRVEVLHEQGLYQHYRCAAPGTSNYHFHVVTFPGRLIITGDIGDLALERCPDMLAWASESVESIGYFAEKVWPCIETKEWSEDTAREVVEERYKDLAGDALLMDDREAAEKASEERDELLAAAGDGPESFAVAYYQSDWYDGDFPSVEEYTHEFLRCREALRWFLRWYKTTRPESLGEASQPQGA